MAENVWGLNEGWGDTKWGDYKYVLPVSYSQYWYHTIVLYRTYSTGTV
jgi:hypothetical protein